MGEPMGKTVFGIVTAISIVCCTLFYAVWGGKLDPGNSHDIALAMISTPDKPSGSGGPAFDALPPSSSIRPGNSVNMKPFEKFPIYFIENQGQTDASAAYYVKGRDKAIYFTAKGLIYVLSGENEKYASSRTGIRNRTYSSGSDTQRKRHQPGRWVVKLDFVGANADVRPEGRGLTSARISYFKGRPEAWKTGLKTYREVVYRDLWPGIDLAYEGTVNRLKYRFVVRPGADPRQIRLAYRGADVSVTDAGRLRVNTGAGGFEDDTPYAYQGHGDGRQTIKCAYQLDPGGGSGAVIYGFELGPYDRSKQLVLDPAVLVYCGYIGGGNNDWGHGIAVDNSGNAYIAGATKSDEDTFPVSVGPDLTYNGGYDKTDAFVAKVKADGSGLVYCGYIGGSKSDGAGGIAVVTMT